MEREKQKVLEGERQAEEARKEEEARMKAKKEAEDELQRRLEAGEQVAPLKSKFVSVNCLLSCRGIFAETRPPVLWTGNTKCGRVSICLDG